jgi:hypothetical protein
MQAGIVVYRRLGSELHGRWSHSNVGGTLAKERIVGVKPGALTGHWPGEKMDVNGHRIFAGYLESVRFGDCFKLTWRDMSLSPDSEGTMEGIGIALDGDTLCASFELVRPKPVPGA